MESKKSNPLVSIVMAVYNSDSSIEESLKSLIAQTYKEIEIIVVLDGCKDNTEKIVRSLSAFDDRIKVYKRANHGLTKSLNYGIKKATGSLIARQDADDMSYPLRIQKQVEIMVQKADVSLIGSEVIETNGSVEKIWPCPNCENIKNILKYRNIFAHSTAMFRRDDFLSVGGYDESFYVSQDFELWMRMSNKGEVICIQEPLVIRVWSDSSITAKRKYEQLLNSFRARYKHRNKSSLYKIFLATAYQAICTITPHSVLNSIRKILIFFGVKKI